MEQIDILWGLTYFDQFMIFVSSVLLLIDLYAQKQKKRKCVCLSS